MKKTQLLIEYFDIESEFFVDEIDKSKYDLKKINEICPPYFELDYEYANGQELDEIEFDKLKEFIVELRKMDFDKYSYGIITRTI